MTEGWANVIRKLQRIGRASQFELDWLKAWEAKKTHLEAVKRKRETARLIWKAQARRARRESRILDNRMARDRDPA